MDRRGESIVRPFVLALVLHIIILSSFFVAVSPEARTITPPQVVVIQATELTFAPSEAAQRKPGSRRRLRRNVNVSLNDNARLRKKRSVKLSF